MSSWIIGRYGALLPWVALVVIVTATFLIDRHWQGELARAQLMAEADASESASTIADAVSNAVAERVGALAAPRMRFTAVEDSIS